MSDLLLDDDFDVSLDDATGDTITVEELEEIRQRVYIALATYKDEVFFAPGDGFDWYKYVLGQKTTDIVTINAKLVQYINSIPGVLEMTSPITFSFDEQTRLLGIAFTAATDYGSIEIEYGV